MRDMANSNEFVEDRIRNRKILRVRTVVQSLFVVAWAMPLTWISQQWGKVGRSIPSCVFHCYYAGGQVCPAASLSCPIGIIGQLCALGVVPVLAIASIFIAGGLVGSLVCGWACPFGFLQDLLSKVPLPKFRIPNWMGYGRYAVLVVLVIGLPYVMGMYGQPYEQQKATICAWCPAGATEAGIPAMVSAAIRGDIVVSADGFVDSAGALLLGWKKSAIIVAFFVAAMVAFRPWCTIFCPLGGFLSLFNHISVLHLRFEHKACTQCNTCRSRCAYGVELDIAVNTPRCLRCLECTTCGAISPTLAGPTAGKQNAATD